MTYYVTWDEKKNGTEHKRGTCIVVANRKEAQDAVLVEQNFRRLNKKPHMFHVTMNRQRPNVTYAESMFFTTRGEWLYAACAIRDQLIRQGGIK